MNIQEFRSYNNNYKKKFKKMPPIYALIPIRRKIYRKTKKEDFCSMDGESKRAKENLRLKRSKPFQNIKYFRKLYEFKVFINNFFFQIIMKKIFIIYIKNEISADVRKLLCMYYSLRCCRCC